MIPIHRSEDDELCGFVKVVDGRCQALSVFGGLLAAFDSRNEAESHVLEAGLASLAEHWHFRANSLSDWQIVCIVEASPAGVTIALDYYSMPGVPTLALGPDDFAGGAELILGPR